MIKVRELNESEKLNFEDKDFIVFFGDDYRYFTKDELKEMVSKCSDVLSVGLKRGDIFQSIINGKTWEVEETTLGKKIRLISKGKIEVLWLHSYIKLVMKAVKKDVKFEDTYVIMTSGMNRPHIELF